MQTCRSCGEEKEVQEFPNRGYGKRRPDCLTCHRAKRKENYCPEANLRVSLKHLYGLTLEEYKDMEEEQGGRCAICGEVPDRHRLYVDHDHKTGEVRGLLCSRCNMGLGQFRDNPRFLEAALDYLAGP